MTDLRARLLAASRQDRGSSAAAFLVPIPIGILVFLVTLTYLAYSHTNEVRDRVEPLGLQVIDTHVVPFQDTTYTLKDNDGNIVTIAMLGDDLVVRDTRTDVTLERWLQGHDTQPAAGTP